MGYRKFSADHLFTGYEMLGDGWVLVAGDSGEIEEIVSAENAGEGVEKLNGIISPGFINCHCHLELSHMKGVIPEGKGMVQFLLTVMGSRGADQEIILQSIAGAEQEMIRNGIVAVGDICNTPHTLAQKSISSLHYQNFIEALGMAGSAAETRFNQNLGLLERFNSIGQPVSIVPHAPYSVSAELFRLINNFGKNNLLSMHNQESIAENEFFINGKGEMLALYEALKINVDEIAPTGKSSIKNSLPYFSPEHSLILVHNVVTSRDDLEWINSKRTSFPELFWCLCPNANLYITGKLPDMEIFTEYSETMVIGTDSLASNHELSILSELKTLQKNFPRIHTAELLRWATSNGAKALRAEEKLGSFGNGKKPGIILIEETGANQSLESASCRVIL